MTDELINPLDYIDNPGELEVQRELQRMGIRNHDCPEVCPGCGGELACGEGYVGETLVYCPNEKCDKGILWEDSEDAIRRIL